ncbi:hypothetical protein [Amycolatopsis thermoflava]|uniref:hypothetical protein n=1 Tax=Amycolatopsis thermoflava TaxID=84480 RepID=UPI001AE0B13D
MPAVAAGPSRVYVTNYSDGTVTVIDVPADQVTGTIPVGDQHLARDRPRRRAARRRGGVPAVAGTWPATAKGILRREINSVYFLGAS